MEYGDRQDRPRSSTIATGVRRMRSSIRDARSKHREGGLGRHRHAQSVRLGSERNNGKIKPPARSCHDRQRGRAPAREMAHSGRTASRCRATTLRALRSARFAPPCHELSKHCLSAQMSDRSGPVVRCEGRAALL
jgi:hypothetical protein